MLYGDNNRFAAYAFWLFTVYGHEKLYLMDGGRKKWLAEGRPLTTERPTYPRTQYRAKEPNLSIRAFSAQILPNTWFVLRYLLGYPDVRNYDGSWTEWGNLVGAPIERETVTTKASAESPCPS